MKHIRSIIVGSLFAILIMGGTFAARLHAQDGPGIIFTVPFAFSADGKNIPAGTYELNLVSNKFMMSIRNLETGELQVFSVYPDQEQRIESHGRLVFHGCGDRKDLAEFHIPGTSIYSKTITLRREKILEAKACPSNESVSVASR